MKFITTLLFSLSLLVAIQSKAQSANIEKSKFNASKDAEDRIGYTQAVRVGNTIYISGIPGLPPMDEALKRIYSQAEKILATYNATLQNVVKENAYTTQIDELIKYQELRKQFYKNDYPASTWVEIKRLYMPEAIVEIDFVAVVKDK
jgi:enamine deaminase RidA (YjgF/YER057c/UK114 family)